MTGVGVAFGVGLAVTGGYAVASPQRWLSLGAWACLVAGWLATVLIAPYGAAMVWIWPFMDTVFGTLCMSWAVRHKAYWAAILALLFLGQTVTHLAWNIMQVFLPTDGSRLWRYYASVNGLLVAQMVCVSWPGACHGVALLVYKLRNVFGARRGQGVAAP